MAKEDRKQRTQSHELRRRARKLGVPVESLEDEQLNDKKRKRDAILEDDQLEIPEYHSDDEELEKRPIKKAKSRAEEEDDTIIRTMEKKLGMRSKSKNTIGDGLDFLFEGIGDNIEEGEGEGSEDGSDEVSHQPSSSRKAVDPTSIFGKGWKRADKEVSGSESGNDSEDGELGEGIDSETNSNSDGDGDAIPMELGESDFEGGSDVSGEQTNMDEEQEEESEESDFGLGIDDGSTDSSDDGTMFGSGNPYIVTDTDSDSESDDDEEDASQDDSSSSSVNDPSTQSSLPLVPAAKAGAYIPPALRARLAAATGKDDQQLGKMSRELRGLVNRLSDSNIATIFEMIEGLFSKYSRKAVNDELVRMLLDDCIASVGGATVFTFAPTYAALTMMLHLTIGAEVGGNIVQGSARELQRRLEANDIPVSRNLLLLFINFYNYAVVHCSMVYEIIRVLIKMMNEQNVDLLLLLIQRCGSQLRKDDPGAIKEIITMVNEVTSQWKAESEAFEVKKDGEALSRGRFTKRVQFMIESLNDVKNNKIMARESDSATMRMKDAIETYWKKRFKTKPIAEPIRISWNDLVSSDHLGRWWVVGSATQIPSEQRADVRKEAQLKRAMNDVSRGKTDEVDSLARTQHMTSATRKAIFSIIVTSEDYIDACEKLTRFNVKDVKPREVIQVLLQCCQQESSWNPYYASIAEKLCAVDPHYRISLKFLLWEKFDQMEEATVRALTNLAKLYAYLIGSSCMHPTILKAYPFEGPSPHAIVFLRMLLASLFLEFEPMVVMKQFVQCANSKDFAELAQHLDIFIQQNMKALKPSLLQHCRIHSPPYKVSDSASVEHVAMVCASIRKAFSQAALI